MILLYAALVERAPRASRDPSGGRPRPSLFGRLEDGRSFLVRARRLVPPFYFEKDDAARAREKGVLRQVSTDQVTLLRRPAAVGGVQRHEGTDPVDAVGVAAQEPPT